jgi:hypothetical protein
LASLFARLRWPEAILALHREPELLDRLVQARPHGGIRNAEFCFDILDHTAILDEDFKEGEVTCREAAEPVEGEMPLDAGAAIAALQFRDMQLRIADGALARRLMELVRVIVSHGRVLLWESNSTALWRWRLLAPAGAIIVVVKHLTRTMLYRLINNVNINIKNINIEF